MTSRRPRPWHSYRRSETEWRDWIINALGGACAGIRVELRDAAVRARTVNTRAQRAEILGEAAVSVLGPACATPEPLGDAQTLAASCPLPTNVRLHFSASELSDMRALDYALLNAILKSLIDSDQYSEEAERFALAFALSAEILGEAERTKSRPRSKPSRGAR